MLPNKLKYILKNMSIILIYSFLEFIFFQNLNDVDVMIKKNNQASRIPWMHEGQGNCYLTHCEIRTSLIKFRV